MKIGVYFCKCGTNIAEKIDPERVEKDVRALPNVAY
jgi:heterodisulfide reductase subunit A-like polyferredoxin